MPDVINLAFASRPTARLDSGLAADRPSVPAGVGDAYYSTDTHVLNLADTAGSAWEQYDFDNITTPPVQDISARVRLTSAQTGVVPNTLTAVSWATADYDTSSFWSGGSPTRLTIPTSAKKYRVIACLAVAAVLAGQTWIQLRLNGTTEVASAVSYGITGANTFAVRMSLTYKNVRTAGDYLELLFRHGDASNADIATTGTFLEITQEN